MNRIWLVIFVLGTLNGCKSKDGDLNVFSTDDDVNFGKEYAAQIIAAPQQFPVLDEQEYAPAYKSLRAIASRITQSQHLLHPEEFAWQLYIIHNDSVLNAFCTPGGYIYVYTGLIKYLDSEDELAGVLGHEIAHADLRHSTEQMTKQYGVGLLFQLIFGSSSTISSMAGSLVNLGFSRADETEADMQSVIYLNDTEYDARGAARFFEKLDAEGNGRGQLQFLNTHPNPGNRVEKIITKWKSLGSIEGKKFTERYEQLKQSLP